jgi:hypothetical protein
MYTEERMFRTEVTEKNESVMSNTLSPEVLLL